MTPLRALSRPPRLLGIAATWTIVGAGLGLLAAIAVPLAVGLRPLTVLSGSMEPAIGTGDIVVVEKIAPLDAHPGDIVTYRDPKRSDRLITHRVRRVRARGGEVEFITKGDANNSVEHWTTGAEGELSQVRYRVPLLGHVLSWTRTREGRLLIFVLPLLLLGAYELLRTWRPRRKEIPGDAAA